MPTDVIMPQMGESIVEGTIVRWHRAVGDIVERDDPLFDIATDKVDTEVPAALNGRLAEILVSEGETVEVNTVVARIVAEGEAWPPEEPSGSEREAPPAADEDSPDRPDPGEAAPEPSPRRRRPRSSPLVRRIAREHRVDLAEMTGTGDGGRVSKKDILSFLDRRKEAPETAEAPATDVSVPLVVPELVVPELPPRPSEDTSHRPVGSRTEPLSRMRRSIAEHMVQSRRAAAHVTTVFEVDMTRVTAARSAAAATFEARTGIRLTLTPFFATAAVEALGEFPVLNASITEEEVTYHGSVNLGIAVALPDGLIVPVLERADERNFVGLARGIHHLASRARDGSLASAEAQGGTFTITNPGRYGSLFGTPIIAQPQVAILAVGGVHKRAVVVADDAIAVRSVAFLALSFDHRLIDGAIADQFMASVKARLEIWPEGIPGMAVSG